MNIIRIRMDPYYSGSLDPDPHWGQSWIQIRIRIETIADPQHLLPGYQNQVTGHCPCLAHWCSRYAIWYPTVTQCCNPWQSRSFSLSLLISSLRFIWNPRSYKYDNQYDYFNGNAYRFLKHHGCIPVRIFRNSGYQSSWLICFVCYLLRQNMSCFFCCLVYWCALKHTSRPHESYEQASRCLCSAIPTCIFENLQ